jgi:O-antigen/teichoic acid export membrane protein
VLHIVRSALVAEVRLSAIVTLVCAVVNAAGSYWIIPRYGLRGAAANTLASFVLYFVGMTFAAKSVRGHVDASGPEVRYRPETG